MMRNDPSMSQRPFERSTKSLLLQRSYLMHGLAWLGGLGVLSSGMVWAQNDPNPDQIVPTVQESEPAPEPVFIPRKAVPENPIPAISPRRSSAGNTSRESGVVPRRSTSVRPRRAVETREAEAPKPKLAAPRLSSPIASPERVAPERVAAPASVEMPNPFAEAAPRVRTEKNQLVDPSDYSVGATQREERPAVVLTERRERPATAGVAMGGDRGVLRRSLQNAAEARTQIAERPTLLARRLNPEQSVIPNFTTRQTTPLRQASVVPLRSRQRTLVASRSLPSLPPQVTNRVNNVLPNTGRVPFNPPTNFQGYKTNAPLVGRPSNGNIAPLFPVTIPAPITSLFGWRIHPISGGRRFHAGTDIGAPMGTPVIAAYSGQVSVADVMGGYGLAVVLQHNERQETLYAHLSEILVQPGQWIEQGTVIGRVGSTGNSTGPHLHFEIRELTEEGWVARDPSAVLEYALADLIQSMQTAQAAPPSTPQGGS